MSHQSLLKRPDGSWLRSLRWADNGKRDFFPMPPVTDLPSLPAYFSTEGDAEIVVAYLFQASGVRARVVKHVLMEISNEGAIEEADANQCWSVVLADAGAAE